MFRIAWGRPLQVVTAAWDVQFRLLCASWITECGGTSQLQ
jgi:hypothetical protein